MNNFEMEIWYNLCGFYPELKKKIISPFRSSDRNPGASFGFYNNWVRFYDAADPRFHGKTALQVYSIQNNLSFEDALKECKEKFSRKGKTEKSDTKIIPIETKSTAEIKPIKMKWNDEGKKYWSNLGVSSLKDMFLEKSNQEKLG